MVFETIPLAIYREKVLGCWLGKAVGGTLGGPVEGKPGPLSLTYYDPVPDKMLPNDDLDLQIVWMEAIRRHGFPIERRMLAGAWLEHIHFWPDEYGVASRNLAQGIYPPVSGWFDNGFTAGMGAAIRTEIWACLAPGDPELAAIFASEDACVDHAEEGLYAARYLAALQSMAFVESDREVLLDTAKEFIPDDCRVALAIADTRQWWVETQGWKKVREYILAEHGRQNFTDVAQNLAFTVLGWLAGSDFSEAICTAVNCGADTDCTGATLGALLGILDPDNIDEKWLKPIGRDLVLSSGMVGMHNAYTLDELTDQVAALAMEVHDYYESEIAIGDAPLVTDIPNPRNFRPDFTMIFSEVEHTTALVAAEPLVVYVTYPSAVALAPGEGSIIGLLVTNPTKYDFDIKLKVRCPDGWLIDEVDFNFSLASEDREIIALSITPPQADSLRVYKNPLDLIFNVGGLCWTATAGMIATTPWLRWPIDSISEACPEPTDNAAIMEVPGHFQSLPDGFHAFAAEFKLPHDQTLRYIAQAPRETHMWLDGEKINQHDGSYRVPAIHRCSGTGRDIQKNRGWHRLTIAVGDGKDGDLFACIGNGESWDWLSDIEWRVPR